MTSTAGSDQKLRLLAAGSAEPVLVADFQALTTAPRLSRMLSERAAGRPVYQFDPVNAMSKSQSYLTVAEVAGLCVSLFLSSGPAPGRAFVVGHCTSAGLALHIARLLERTREVTAVLVQPTWPDEDHVSVRFADFQAKIGAVPRPCPDLSGDPRDCAAQMEQILREELTEVAVSQGLPVTRKAFTDLLAWYRGWLSFLLACHHDPPAARATEQALVAVLCDAPDGVTVPGLGQGSYQISRLPELDTPSSVTPQVVELVLERLASSSA